MTFFDPGVGSANFHNTWIIDNMSTRNMTGMWRVFQSIAETGPIYVLEIDIGNPQEAIIGVGTMCF